MSLLRIRLMSSNKRAIPLAGVGEPFHRLLPLRRCWGEFDLDLGAAGVGKEKDEV